MVNAICRKAEEALHFLKSREAFWDQVGSGRPSKHEQKHHLNNLRLKEYFDEKSKAARERMLRKRRKSSRPEPKPSGAAKWRIVYKTHRWTQRASNKENA